MPAPRLDSVPSVDFCSTEENAEVVKEVQKDSCLTLQRSLEVLSPSSPSTTALETDVSVRDNLDRKTSFNGNVLFCCCLVQTQLLITQPNGGNMLGSSGANIRSALLGLRWRQERKTRNKHHSLYLLFFCFLKCLQEQHNEMTDAELQTTSCNLSAGKQPLLNANTLNSYQEFVTS